VTSSQLFSACVALAPNFRVDVEYTTLNIVPRALVWHGRRPADIQPMTAGILFPEGALFEPLFHEILVRAYAALSGP